jgi:hypothetical protein
MPADETPARRRPLSRRDQKWFHNLKRLQTWVERHEGLPRTFGADREDEERELGTWIRTQRVAWASRTDAQRALLESIPGFFYEPLEEKWDDQEAAYDAFVNERGRRPHRDSPDPREKRLAHWFDHQVARRKTNLEHRRRVELAEIERRMPQNRLNSGRGGQGTEPPKEKRP